jgi:hypothetical protein
MEQHETRLAAAGVPYRPLARRTSWPDQSGRIVASPHDAVIHGTEIVRSEDGALGGWKDPFTTVAWRVYVPAAGEYRVRVLTEPSGDATLQAIIGGQVLRASAQRPAVFKAAAPGAFLLVLQSDGSAATGGPPVLRGVELLPIR